MRHVKRLVELESVGQRINPSEMATLRSAYRKVIKAVAPFGEKYRLVLNDATQQACKLDRFLQGTEYED